MDCGRNCLLVDYNFKLRNLQTQQFNNYIVVNVYVYTSILGFAIPIAKQVHKISRDLKIHNLTKSTHWSVNWSLVIHRTIMTNVHSYNTTS